MLHLSFYDTLISWIFASKTSTSKTRPRRATFRMFLTRPKTFLRIFVSFPAICANCTSRYACPRNFIYAHRSFYFYLRLSSHVSSYQQYDAFPLRWSRFSVEIRLSWSFMYLLLFSCVEICTLSYYRNTAIIATYLLQGYLNLIAQKVFLMLLLWDMFRIYIPFKFFYIIKKLKKIFTPGT